MSCKVQASGVTNIITAMHATVEFFQTTLTSLVDFLGMLFNRVFPSESTSIYFSTIQLKTICFVLFLDLRVLSLSRSVSVAINYHVCRHASRL